MKKLLHIIRYGAISPIWSWLSIALIKIGGPKVAAYFSYRSIDWGDMKEGQTILCLYRESFIKDVIELRKRTALNYPIVMGGFTRFQMAWFPQNMQVQTFYQAYLNENERAIEQGTIYARHLIQLVNQKVPVQGILSANFDYWQDAVFKKVCKELDIPFLVLSREHPIIPKVCDYVTDRYRKADYHFEGTAIAVAGRSTKNVIEKVKTVCAPEQVVITGLPRYDAWLDVDTSRSLEERPFITLLTFTKGYYADQTFVEVLQLFCEAAEHHANSPVTFLVKTKDAADTLAVKSMMNAYGLLNLQCDHEVNLFDVLPRSRMVINYNSLSLIEAVMARAWIAIPVWGQCMGRGGEAMYSIDNSKVANVVNFTSRPDVLMDTISACVAGQLHPISDENIRDFLGEYIHIPDSGTYCQEFENFVMTNLQDKSKL